MLSDLEHFAQEDFCYLTTSGRISGRSHTIEIWFALDHTTLYMLAGDRDKSDWVKNILKQPAVSVKLGAILSSGLGRIVSAATEEDALARQLVFDKYVSRSTDDLTDWSRTSLPVAVDLQPSSSL